MSREEIQGIIEDYCTCIIDVLLSQDAVDNLTDDDYDLFDRIGQKTEVDYFTLDEVSRIKMENFLYEGCNSYADAKFRAKKAFDVGNGTERIERYLQLMAKHLGRDSIYDLPEILISINDSIKIRLEMIGLTSAFDQEILLNNGRLRKDIATYKGEVYKIQDEIETMKEDIDEELISFGERKTDIYKDIITIISIFSGIILTFSGAFSFSSTILENIDNANFPKIIIAACIILLFLLSLFFGLFWFTYGVVYNKPLINLSENRKVREEKKRIKHYKALLFVPMTLICITLIAVIIVVIICFHNELTEDISKPEELRPTVSVVYETQQEDVSDETTTDNEQTGAPTPEE